jgi:hypothetical protein
VGDMAQEVCLVNHGRARRARVADLRAEGKAVGP